MKKFIQGTAIALVLVCSAGLAGAQVGTPAATTDGKGDSAPKEQLQLSPVQKAMIFTAIRRSTTSVTPPPGNFRVAVGAQVSSSIALYALPDAAVDKVPDAKSYKYTIINDTLILVDPTSMQVVDTIRQ
jgi:Protein of unknown function (DUF1236)